jgi:hypothetical protein
LGPLEIANRHWTIHVKSKSRQTYITTGGQSSSLSWCQEPITNFFPSLFNCFYTVAGLLMWGALSDEKSALQFSVFLGIASVAFLRSESHGTHEHILWSLFLRLPQPGGPGSYIYFPQEQSSPVIPPGIGFV